MWILISGVFRTYWCGCSAHRRQLQYAVCALEQIHGWYLIASRLYELITASLGQFISSVGLTRKSDGGSEKVGTSESLQ